MIKNMIYATTELQEILKAHEQLILKAANILTDVIKSMNQNGSIVTTDALMSSLNGFSEDDKSKILATALANISKSKISNTSTNNGARSNKSTLFNNSNW